MHVQIRDNDSHKFGFSVGQDPGHFIFLIIQRFQGIGDDLLVLQGQGVRVVEIPGNCGLGEIGVFRDIVKGYVLFSHSSLIPLL